MTVPQIFCWPTPWLWGGNFGHRRLERRPRRRLLLGAGYRHHRGFCHLLFPRTLCLRDGEQVVEGGLDERVEQIERRLTDTRDVMIALSEKVDRLEEEGRVQPTPSHDAGTLS
ncbi:MAG: hypothetical protein VYB08_15520 [Candidatus Latescibacterota bacterium]|nr:hypothetical protein [Candidatus Latescibacterota bacterium]